MKRRQNILLLSVILLTSCSDYLGIKPKGYDIASRLDHFEGLIYGMENVWLDEVFPYMSFEQNLKDEAAYQLAYSFCGEAACNAWKWKADIFRSDDACGEWNCPAAMLYPLNVVVNNVMEVENATEAEKLAVRSEARMIRAYNTFLMAQFFGKPYDSSTADTDLCVPIIREANTQNTDFPRQTVASVYDYVITEMTESLPYLPSLKEHSRRAFKFTGYLMLGKVYWMKGDWENAFKTFQEAMEILPESECKLLDYNDICNSGSISYPMDELLNPELVYSVKLMTNIYSVVLGCYDKTPAFTISKDVMAKYFSPDDLRLCAYDAAGEGISAYKNLKKDSYHLNISKYSGDIGIGLADFYIMYAETAARLGEEDLARTLLTELRKNRMDSSAAEVTATGDNLIIFAVEEGFREHLAYGNNWFDMRRLWNDPLFQGLKSSYIRKMGGETWALTPERLVMRIPPSIMQWHSDYINNN